MTILEPNCRPKDRPSGPASGAVYATKMRIVETKSLLACGRMVYGVPWIGRMTASPQTARPRIRASVPRRHLGGALMRLRPVNLTKRAQDADHARLCETARRYHERRYADRDPNGDVFQQLHQKFFDMGPTLPDPPRRSGGSEQRVMVLRSVTLGDGMHPEARQYFDADELVEVIDEERRGDAGSGVLPACRPDRREDP